MRYYIDTEFIESFHKPFFGKRRHFIDLISVGIVCEDGRKYHAISREYRYRDADPWVRENVIVPLYMSTVHGVARNSFDATNFQYHYGKSNADIANDIRRFFGCWQDQHFWKAPEGINVYGYYADYDWVLLCSLFGRMIDLPKGFPMYCRDLKQMVDSCISPYELRAIGSEAALTRLKNHPDYPRPAFPAHSAIADAIWNRDLHQFLLKLRRS